MPDNNNQKIIATTLTGQAPGTELSTNELDTAIQKAKEEGKFIDGNIWEILRQRKAKGEWQGEIETIVPKTIMNLSSGAHYYEIEDIKKRSVACVTCPIKHGGILEAHLLTRYKVANGIIYLDDKAMTRTS